MTENIKIPDQTQSLKYREIFPVELLEIYYNLIQVEIYLSRFSGAARRPASRLEIVIGSDHNTGLVLDLAPLRRFNLV